ncbi:MAG: hypothetical protein GY756_25290 [bacterium]|nr:hypothetical protein [bacterium]
MNPISSKLKKEADFLLFDCRIYEILKEIGEVHFTGSYKLDLMVWPDIDIYLTIPESKDIITALGTAAGKLIANHKDIVTVKIERNYSKRLTGCPPGQYLQLKIQTDNFDSLWKVDIWVLPKKLLRKKLKETDDFFKLMTPDKRDLILKCKQILKGNNSRPPSFSSYHVYKAVFEERMTDVKNIITYVKTKI